MTGEERRTWECETAIYNLLLLQSLLEATPAPPPPALPLYPVRAHCPWPGPVDFSPRAACTSKAANENESRRAEVVD